jgi:hypothetical protein
MVHRHLRLKKRERGLDEASYLESFLVLNLCAAIAWKISIGCGKTMDCGRCWAMKFPRRERRGSSVETGPAPLPTGLRPRSRLASGHQPSPESVKSW